MELGIGKLYVRRCSLIQASAAEIWEHFQSQERLAQWFGIGQRVDAFEPGADGSISLSIEMAGERQQFGGKILLWEPEFGLCIENNWFDEALAWSAPTYITFKLSESDDGTLVELFHHGFEALGHAGAAQHEMYEAGWNNQHLVALRKLAETSEIH